jgi:hypothetical protein
VAVADELAAGLYESSITHVKHEGERPMAVTWKLQTPLSGDLFAAFAAAVA